MKLLLTAVIIVLMNIGTIHAQVEDDAAADSAPDAAVQQPAQEPMVAQPEKPTIPAKTTGPLTPEAAAEKLGIDASQNADVLEQIKRDAAQRAAISHATPEQPANNTAPPNITYDRTQRFNRPLDRVVEYRNAQNVVINDVDYNSLPASVRTDIQEVVGTCPESVAQLSDLKSYSYVSDLQRSRGLSPNYFIDFSKLVSKKQSSCAAMPPCNADGCMFMTFNTIGYNNWKK
ncbi:MAG: hypothetical protein K2Q32_01230, partial [Alphaproteobacteria bacterium]|nr:hypothetical protein [Alphaproteobacteria bacterium]